MDNSDNPTFRAKFTPPDYLLGFIVLQIISNYLIPLKKFIYYPYNLVGIPLIIFGFYLNIIWVSNIFEKNKTTTDPYKKSRTLVTEAYFKLTRNPTYLGMALTLLGVAIVLGSLSSFFIAIIFIILTDRLTIPIEERNLEKAFGKTYINYKKKVRRWI